MKRSVMISTVVFALLSLVFLAFGSWRYASAVKALDRSQSRAEHLAAQCSEVDRLRALQPTAFVGEPPNEAVIAAVRAALQASELPTRALARLDADRSGTRDRARSDTAMTTSTVRVDLNGLTPRQLGSFLVTWSASEPLWVPVEITLDAEPRSPGQYRVTLVLEAQYIETTRTAETTSDA